MTTETGEKTEPVFNKSTAMLIDETTLHHFGPRGGRKNLQGEDLTPPEVVVSFSAEADRFDGKMNKLLTLYKAKGAVRLWLEFTEQLPLPLKPHPGDSRPRLTDELGTMPRAQQNGNGKAHVDDLKPIGDTAKEIAADVGAPTPITAGKKGRKK